MFCVNTGELNKEALQTGRQGKARHLTSANAAAIKYTDETQKSIMDIIA